MKKDKEDQPVRLTALPLLEFQDYREEPGGLCTLVGGFTRNFIATLRGKDGSDPAHL